MLRVVLHSMMNSTPRDVLMKTSYIFLGVIGILMYNMFLIQRDQKMFDAYDRACAQLPQPHPDCRYAQPIK